MNNKIITIILFYKNDNEILTKLDFIHTCKYASIMYILSQFEFGATQIGFRPHLTQLICTASFVYFIKTSKCLIYNIKKVYASESIKNLKIYQIIKHKENGINNFEITKDIDISFLRSLMLTFMNKYYNKHIISNNNIVNTILKIQYNNNEPIIIKNDVYYHLSTGCSFLKQNNIDVDRMLYNFIHHLYKKLRD